MFGREVDLVRLVKHARGLGSMSGVYKRRILVYCLFCAYLFDRGTNNYGHASVVNIVEQCEAGRSPMAMCAGELLLSLDQAVNNSSRPFAGCPLILQVLYSVAFATSNMSVITLDAESA